jgi:hypothetical protein
MSKRGYAFCFSLAIVECAVCAAIITGFLHIPLIEFAPAFVEAEPISSSHSFDINHDLQKIGLRL